MHRKETCSICSKIEEEDTIVDEEADSAKAERTKDHHMNTTSTTGKTSETVEERLIEEEASMSDRVDKITPSNAGIVGNSETKKMNTERRNVSRPAQADNSPIMPITLTTTIMEGCS